MNVMSLLFHYDLKYNGAPDAVVVAAIMPRI